MHANPAFCQSPAARDAAFARARAFGVLALNGPQGLLLAHVPFLLAADATSAELHLVRSNPIARALVEPTAAVIAISGPDGYVSPDWYGVADQVPTRNDVAVHLRGSLTLLPDAELHPMLDRQSAHFEDQLAPKRPWTTAKMTPDVMARMLRQIVPARLTITAIDGTWKLGQNKPQAVRLSAAAMLARDGLGADRQTVAALMAEPGE